MSKANCAQYVRIAHIIAQWKGVQMTKQEAISFIRNIEIECEQCPYYGECDDDFLLCVDAKDVAIECIEKQIPKKPKPIYLDYCDEPTIVSYNCIKCGLEVGVNYADGHKVREHHCCCGQAILWESDNE